MKDATLSRRELTWDERAALPEGALPWERFRDPDTRRVYWVNPSKDAEPKTWFYADTGSPS